MKRLLSIALLFAAVGCSKSNPTGPIVETDHGDVSLSQIAVWGATGPIISGGRMAIFHTTIYTKHTEREYISRDSCRATVYLNNARSWSFPTMYRFSWPSQPDAVEYDAIIDSRYSTQFVLSDTLATPDSVITVVTYTNSTGIKQKRFKVTPADPAYSFNLIHNP